MGAMAIGSEMSDSGLRGYFTALRPRLLRFLAARLGNPADAEDILQDMWLKLDRLQSGPIASPDAYLHKMALNLANDLIRQRNRGSARDAAWLDASSGDGHAGEGDPAPSPEREVAGRQELQRLTVAIAALPERAREVFQRHRLHGESHGDVAAALGISKSAVEKHMATAMRHLLIAMNEGDPT